MTGRWRGVAGVVAALLVATGLVAGPVSSSPAAAADLSQFAPGNIISDDVFYAGTSMSQSDIQAFLATKGADCRIGADGSACLKDYRVTTWTRPADDRCTGTYQGATDELASTIIAKVAEACGINPRVLVVTLQKEQGLVTTTGAAATDARYRKAMGYGCPDTAPCDAQYYGFFNQVYKAAWQFRSYKLKPTSFSFRAGITANVRFHPDASCGSAPVYIANAATAALYNYTPYQPNAAALAAGYGTGDACSSYGNRNFWNYFTDWFGPTSGISVSPQMTALWQANGGARGPIGYPLAGQRCDLVPTGCSQQFSGATIFWSPSTGAQAVGGLILSRWNASGGLAAGIGYPTSTVLGCAESGCAQTFQSGMVTWSSATGAQLVGGQIFARWAASGGFGTGIGYPTSTVLLCDVAAGCTQTFQNGAITWSGATGAQIIGGILRATWEREGGATSWLGYPTSTTLACDAGTGCVQSFSGGAVVWSAATGARTMPAALSQGWIALGGTRAGIGLPVESVSTCAATGCAQEFQSGTLTWSGSGSSQIVGGIIRSRWLAAGGSGGPLGWPTSTVTACDAGTGCVQTFQGGAVTWSASTGAQVVGGEIYQRWRSSGLQSAGIGLPTETVLACPSTGCVQQFQGGVVAWSASTGAQLVGGAIYGQWNRARTTLGLPTDTVLGCTAAGCRQTFTGGVVTWSPAGGAQAVVAPVLTAWDAAGGAASPLGWPASTVTTCPAPGGCQQTFVSGLLDWTSARGAVAVVGPIYTAWRAAGGPSAGIGRPVTTSLGCDQTAGCTQTFESGAVAASTRTGAHVVGGQIYGLWSSLGGPTSSLGLPTSTVLGCSSSGCTQTFEHGSITWRPSTGAQVG